MTFLLPMQSGGVASVLSVSCLGTGSFLRGRSTTCEKGKLGGQQHNFQSNSEDRIFVNEEVKLGT